MLSLNLMNSKCMQKLATLSHQPAVEIDGNYIERVKNFKCLRLNIDEILTWDAHIATISELKIT